jgi:hypothetical protein
MDIDMDTDLIMDMDDYEISSILSRTYGKVLNDMCIDKAPNTTELAVVLKNKLKVAGRC